MILIRNMINIGKKVAVHCKVSLINWYSKHGLLANFIG